MRHENRYRYIRLILFLLILITLYFCIGSLFLPQHNIFPYKPGKLYHESQKGFYDEPANSLDFVFVGSSHAQVTYSPAIIWEESGLKTYTMTSSGNPVWVSYYYFQEILKTQKPKAIIYEIYPTLYKTDYGYSELSYASIDSSFSTRSSIDQLAAIAMGSWRLLVDQKSFSSLHYALTLPQYHQNWKYINRTSLDTNGNAGLRGFMPVFADYSNPEELVDYQFPSSEKTSPPHPVTLKYLDKMIDLCQEKQVELIFAITPFAKNQHEHEVFNYVKTYASEKGVKILDMFDYYDEIGLNLSEDYYNKGHTNYNGGEKISKWIAAYLRNSYPMEDIDKNRNNTVWNGTYDLFLRYIKNIEMEKIRDLRNYCNLLKDKSYLSIIRIADTAMDSPVLTALQSQGFYTNENHGKSSLLIYNGENLIFESNDRVFTRFKTKEIQIDINYMEAEINGEYAILKEEPYQIIVYDLELGRFVDVSGINPSNLEMVR